MYVQEDTLPSFKTVIKHLINKEEYEIFIGSKSRYFDVLNSETRRQTTHQLEKVRQGDLQYANDFKPILGRRDLCFRKRPAIYNEGSPWDNGRPNSIKVTRVGFGYCYMNACGRWDAASDTEDYKINNERLKSTLEFLFIESPPNGLTLQIRPDHGAYNIDLGSPSSLSAELCKIFEEISHSAPIRSGSIDPISWVYAAEIFVHETGTEFVHPLTLAAAESSPSNEPDDADEAGEPSQNHMGDSGNADISSQPQTSRRFSTIVPQTIFESNPGAYTFSRRPSCTPSEIADLKRRVGDSEKACRYQEGQIEFVLRECHEQEQRADASEENVRELVRQISRMQRQQTDSNAQLRAITRERDLLSDRVSTSQYLPRGITHG